LDSFKPQTQTYLIVSDDIIIIPKITKKDTATPKINRSDASSLGYSVYE
jgi:hypothetical protein